MGALDRRPSLSLMSAPRALRLPGDVGRCRRGFLQTSSGRRSGLSAVFADSTGAAMTLGAHDLRAGRCQHVRDRRLQEVTSGAPASRSGATETAEVRRLGLYKSTPTRQSSYVSRSEKIALASLIFS